MTTPSISGAYGRMNMEDAIKVALADRKAKLDTFPVRRETIGDKPCPRCGATTTGPCWINVEADAAFVDAMKELVRTP